jgi:hypothetical protein
LSYLGSALWNLTGVWWAAFTANVLGGLVALWWFRRTFAGLEAVVPANEPSLMSDEGSEIVIDAETEPLPA